MRFATSSERLTNDNLSANDENGPLVDALRRHWDAGLEFDSLWKDYEYEGHKQTEEHAIANVSGRTRKPSAYDWARKRGEPTGCRRATSGAWRW